MAMQVRIEIPGPATPTPPCCRNGLQGLGCTSGSARHKEASGVLSKALQKAGGWSNRQVLLEEDVGVATAGGGGRPSNQLSPDGKDKPGLKQGCLRINVQPQQRPPTGAPTVAAPVRRNLHIHASTPSNSDLSI